MSQSAEEKKIKIVLSWYRKETEGFSKDKRKIILEKWIKICSEEEEYKLASALQEELACLKKGTHEHVGFWRFVGKKLLNFWKIITLQNGRKKK